MPADAEIAKAYALRYTVAQLQAFLDAALEAVRESATITRSFEGSSMTISAENARQVVFDLTAALEAKQAHSASKDAILTAAPWSTGIDFSPRQIE